MHSTCNSVTVYTTWKVSTESVKKLLGLAWRKDVYWTLFVVVNILFVDILFMLIEVNLPHFNMRQTLESFGKMPHLLQLTRVHQTDSTKIG